MTNFKPSNLKRVDESAIVDTPPPVPPKFTPVKKEGQEPRQEPRQESFSSVMEDKAIGQHPVLKKLRSKLGIKRNVVHTCPIYVDGDIIEFGFTEYSEELSLWSATQMRFMHKESDDELKASKSFDLLRMGLSLVSIDNTPSYEVYGIEPNVEEINPSAPLNLSDNLRKKVAICFHNFVLNEGKAFFDILEDFWIEKIFNSSDIRKSTTGEVFVCEVEGCNYTHKGESFGEYYCVTHGKKLKKALTKEEKGNYPLA